MAEIKLTPEQIKQREAKFLKIITDIKTSQTQWNGIVQHLATQLKDQDVKNILDVQAESISQRQNITDEIHEYAVRIYKYSQPMKKNWKLQWEFYATEYTPKTNGGEKMKLIEADLADHQFLIDLFDTHVQFLRETSKNLDAIYYGVKTKGDLYNIIGGYK